MRASLHFPEKWAPILSSAEFVDALTAVLLTGQTNLWLSMLFRGNPAFWEIQRGSEDKWKRSRRKCTAKRRYDLTASYLLTAYLKIVCSVTAESGANGNTPVSQTVESYWTAAPIIPSRSCRDSGSKSCRPSQAISNPPIRSRTTMSGLKLAYRDRRDRYLVLVSLAS